MYVTPIRLDLLLNTNQICCCKGKWYVRRFDPDEVEGTVSQTAHVQVINQKWSDVFKFVICKTKWRQQAEDNPHSHGGLRNNSGRKKFFFNSGSGRKQEWEKSVEKKNSNRRKYLQVVVIGQT